MNSKKIFSLIGIGTLLVSFLSISSACSSKKVSTEREVDYTSLSHDKLVAEAKKSKSITFATWWGEEFWTQFGKKFKNKYGIDVKIVKGDAKDTLDKLLVEKDKASIDTFILGGSNVKTAMDAGLMYGPLKPAITDSDKLDKDLFKSQEGVAHNGTLVPIYRNQTGLLYNPKKVSNPPQTWQELEKFISEHPKEFGFCDPNKGGSGQAFIYSVIDNVCGGTDKYFGDTAVDSNKTKDWTKAWKWIKDRKENITITNSNKDSLSRVNSGELSLVFAWDDDAYNTIKNGELFKEAKMYIPKFGTVGGGDTMGVTKKSENKAAAILFINEVVSEEGEKMLNQILSSYPAREGINVDTTLLKQEDLKLKKSWYPAPYKKLLNEEFTKNVLMN